MAKHRMSGLKTKLYVAMGLVDDILGLDVTQGTGTDELTFMDDVKKARTRVKKLIAMEARQIAIIEARGRLEEMI